MRDSPGQEKSSFAADLIDIIQHSRIFAEIDRAATEALLPRLQKIFLSQGEILFEQGDPSDCLYILVDGQLMAMLHTNEGKQKNVGTVEKGETVGELGALSNQPRSLTIRATVDSKLLKLPRKEFEIFCKDQPSVISHIIDLIVYRSQNTLKLISQKKMYKHIAIVKANHLAPINQFLEKLIANFPKNRKFTLLETIPTDTLLVRLMEQAEQDNHSLIFVLNEENIDSVKLHHVGGVFVVADGDIPSPFSDFCLDILSQHRTHFATQYELILVHDNHVTKPTGTKEWLNQATFTMHHHIHIGDDDAYKRIARFITGTAIGLVLGGGGHRGWACLGVIKALTDAKIPIDYVGGTSVGAIIGASYAMKFDYQQIYNDFQTISRILSNPLSFKSLTWPLISLVNAIEPTEALHTLYQDAQIEDLWLPYFGVSCNLSLGKEHIHRHGSLWECLRATAAVPGIAPPMVIDGQLYYDGGLLNNLPADYMRSLLGDESIVIAVSLAGLSSLSLKNYNFPPELPFWVTLLKKLHLGYKEYRFPSFLHTFLEALLVGSSTKEKANQLIADMLIAPDVAHFGVFKLNKTSVKKMIDLGYAATLEQLNITKLFS